MLLKFADAMEERAEEVIAAECQNTGKPIELTRTEEIPPTRRPDPVLRRRRAAARGPQRRRVHGRAHVLHPARAGRRRRPGDAVELPDDDGHLEVRPGARGRQLRRAQAERHHARLDRADGRDRGGVLPARRVQRRLRRPRHRPRRRLAQDTGDGLDHRLDARRATRSPRRRPRTSSAPTSSSAARRR